MRWFNKLYADVFGYFWLPCPRCGRYFGGHEWKHVDQHIYKNRNWQGICLECYGNITQKERNDDMKRWKKDNILRYKENPDLRLTEKALGVRERN